MEFGERRDLDAEHTFAMITELVDIGVPVEKLYEQGLADFEIECIEMRPEDGLWTVQRRYPGFECEIAVPDMFKNQDSRKQSNYINNSA